MNNFPPGSGNNSSEKLPPLHLDFLDGLRAIAALYVMSHHAWLTVFYADRRPTLLQSSFTYWLNYGHFAVDLFIVLSGFCLMIPVVRAGDSLAGGAMTFLKKRARRILPTYYAALAVSLIFATTLLSHKIGTIWDMSLPVTKMGVLAHLLLLQNMHRSMEINSVFWSIAVECQIYLLFPLIIVLWKTIGWQKASKASIITGLVVSFFVEHTRFRGLTAHYLALFTFGMLGAAISFSPIPLLSHYRRMVPWNWISIVLCGLTILICALFTKRISMYNVPIDLLVGFCSATAIIAMARDEKNLLRRILSWKPLVVIGTFSYSLYLIHMPLLQTFWQFVLVPMHLSNFGKLVLLCLCGGPLIVFCSFLFFLAFERPFISNRRIINSNDLAAGVALSPAP